MESMLEEIIRNRISRTFFDEKNLSKENVNIIGKLLDARQSLYAGDLAGSASSTTYIFESLDKKDEDSITFPTLTGVTWGSSKPGDRFYLSKSSEGIRVEIRSKFLNRLKHHFEMTYDEIRKHYFN